MIGAAMASPGRPDGYLDVTFGHVRGPRGAMISLKGLRLPYTIQKIDATRGQGAQPSHAARAGAPPPGTTTVYEADAGSGYGYVDPCPSALDDLVTTSAGPGVPWQELTFGVNITQNHQFLVRWIVFDTYTPGAEPSAFSDVVADFGGILPGYDPGDYKVTVNVSPAGVVMDSSTIYVAQQFRAPQSDGNGPFDDAIGTIFNPTAPPQIGSSENVFWYDAAETGVYDDNEQDNFGDSNFANFLFAILVGGTQDTLVPYTYSVDFGTYSSGDVTSLWYTDGNYLKVQGKFGVTPFTPIAQVTVEGLAASTSATSLTFSLNSGSTLGGGTEQISLYNYSTNAWDLVDTEPMPQSDTNVNVTITSSPTRYVNQSTRHVKAKVSFYKTVWAAPFWVGRIDKTNWIITRP